jgi:glycosyltransferase involved in cell wall biosynthesis
MHVFINFLAASAGGGLTYIRNVIPELAAKPALQVTVALNPDLRQEFQNLANVDLVEIEVLGTRRFWHEQVIFPGVIRRCGADLLLSAGNFALRNSPVPQVLLSRNSLYTSADFYRDLVTRGEYRTWLETRLRGWIARKSIAWADITVAPSEAFAAELRRWAGDDRIVAIHHGFDRETFIRDASSLDAKVQEKLGAVEGAIKLLFVSHYNYYRNFEVLIRALPLLRARLPGRTVKLLLTCKLAAGSNPGQYRPEAAARLVRDLGVSDMVVELGAIPYRQLHQVYRVADLYVTPAYSETFAHPLVEAMSSGLPIVASDLPVHREICQNAAMYFDRFSPQELAVRVLEATTPEVAKLLSDAGVARSAAFSWRKHVDDLLTLARRLVNARAAPVSVELSTRS